MDERTQEDEIHVASLIALVRPHDMDDVRTSLSGADNIEIFAEDPAGKFILVIEAKDTKELGNLSSQIETTKGVMSASLVYHEALDALEAQSPAPIDRNREETILKKQNAKPTLN